MQSRANFIAAVLVGLAMAGPMAPARAMTYVETPMFADKVKAGELAGVAARLPKVPSIVRFTGDRTIGRPGGELRTLIGRAKDVRLLVVYGYARLVGYNETFEIVPDILQSVDVKEGRQFTFNLRPGHKWSDGQPFTAEDFRYWWEDVANNPKISPAGPPRLMLSDGQPPVFEVLDKATVRYTWPTANPFFLPRLAGASPLFIYRPAHYLKQFHGRYADPAILKKLLKKRRTRSWASLHNRYDNMYRFDNPNLPTLQPWVNRTRPPATRFIGVRNPYYHRVDEKGRQLPYLDKFIMIVSDGKLIAAKAGTGEVDLQARSLAFNNLTFLRENEASGGFETYLWRIAKGAHVALFPNLNVADPVWSKLLRNVRFRRALSLAVDREAINESLFFGLALEGNNTLLPDSPLFRETYQKQWAEYDPDLAGELLDEIGLNKYNDDDIRLLPDGRPLEIIVETAGEDTEQTDVLELIAESWAEVGVKLFIKPSQREVFRNRVFSGQAQMSIWSGLENGVATAATSPEELAPTSQQQLMWPKWGQYFDTSGVSGEAPDLPEAQELAALAAEWKHVTGQKRRAEIWHRMLSIHAEQIFSIGVIAGVQQPVVVKHGLKNVPMKGIYNWDPGAHFGIYRPDTFWFDR
ncbi:MAG: ABC transporter substrate-binding protein [Rhodospirillaceae bacterium]|jgi:peptide/nickel transport system substrate-binding protein|nr:ABC transporter substrate-binding protein [Rhodospirillaceae bacterium]